MGARCYYAFNLSSLIIEKIFQRQIGSSLQSLSCSDSQQLGGWIPQSQNGGRDWAELPEFTSGGSGFRSPREMHTR